MSKKYLYYFSEGSQAFGGDKTAMRNILGGKGSGLAEMTAAGMPVPQGFTITTEACTQYYADGRQINAEIQADIFAHVKGLEDLTGKKLGDVENPLLVSVRSGARQSMPGMMDTILNLGLNDASVEGLAKKTGNPRFAYDSYRRFVQMFADVVMGVSKSLFEEEIDKMKAAKGVTNDVDLDADDLKQLVVIFKKIYEDNEHKPFPQDPNEQLIEAVKAVFRSWDNPRANVYRKMNEIPYEWGTAVNVQQMAFGNSGDRSGTGVAFTRDPATGAKRLMGEYLINAQGEDVVAGVRTPSPISHLQDQMPEVYDEFVAIANRLEHYFQDMQDMEFTIEDGKLYMLQTRNGKRTAQAALQIACDLVDEGMITEREAVLRVEPKQLDTLLHPQFDAEALKKADAIGKGLAASPGSACGQIVFSAEEAEEAVKNKMKYLKTKMNMKEATAKEENMFTSLQVVNEMMARGVKFLPVDVYNSDAKVYHIEDGKIRLPFSALGGCGGVAAEQLAAARDDGEGKYLSVEDLRRRASVSKSVIEALEAAGALEDIPKTTQISLFDM